MKYETTCAAPTSFSCLPSNYKYMNTVHNIRKMSSLACVQGVEFPDKWSHLWWILMLEWLLLMPLTTPPTCNLWCSLREKFSTRVKNKNEKVVKFKKRSDEMGRDIKKSTTDTQREQANTTTRSDSINWWKCHKETEKKNISVRYQLNCFIIISIRFFFSFFYGRRVVCLPVRRKVINKVGMNLSWK